MIRFFSSIGKPSGISADFRQLEEIRRFSKAEEGRNSTIIQNSLAFIKELKSATTSIAYSLYLWISVPQALTHFCGSSSTGSSGTAG